MSQPDSAAFLQPGASPRQLVAAVVENHAVWFGRIAESSSGFARSEGGVAWSFGKGRTGAASIVCGADSPLPDARQVDSILAEYRAARWKLREMLGCWTATPEVPGGLGAVLYARGFQGGWQPHWMALDLD